VDLKWVFKWILNGFKMDLKWNGYGFLLVDIKWIVNWIKIDFRVDLNWIIKWILNGF